MNNYNSNYPFVNDNTPYDEEDEYERDRQAEVEHFRRIDGTEDDYREDEEEGEESEEEELNKDAWDLLKGVQPASDDVKQEPIVGSDQRGKEHEEEIKEDTEKDQDQESLNTNSTVSAALKDVIESEVQMMAIKSYPIEHCLIVVRSLFQDNQINNVGLEEFVQSIYDKKPTLKIYSDVELAQYCLSALSKQIVFLKSGEWMVWNKGIWQQTGKDTHLLEHEVLDVLMSAPEHIEDQKQSLALTKRVQNSLTVNKVITSMKRLTSAVDPTKFDSNPDLFNCRNGVLNLSTFEFRQALPSDFLSIQANVEYQPDARCPRFEQFLREILNHDEELYLIVQALMGYILLGGENVERLFFVFTGLGRNGKSTLVRVLMMLMGEYATAIALKSLLQGQQGGPRDDLMSLAQRRLLSISEFEKPAQMSVGFIKSLVGRDTIKARHLYSTQSVDLVLSGVPIATTNNFPTVPGTAGEAFFDRLRMIPFNKRFNADEVNVNLLEEFKEEQSGILNFSLDGLRRYREDRSVLTKETESMLEAKEQCRIQKNALHRFLKQYYIPTTLKESKLSTNEIIADYEQWAANHVGVAKSITSQQLKAEMEAIGIQRNETDYRGYCCRKRSDCE